MTKIANKYMAEMARQFRHRPTWPAQRRLAVGMYGKINKGKFEQHGTLADFDLDLEVADDPFKGETEFKSSKSISINFKAKGDSNAIPGVSAGNAGVRIEFGSANAFVFQGQSMRVKTLTNLRMLRPELLELYENGSLEKDDIIINEIYEAQSCTILASRDQNSSITLEAAADIGSEKAKLADAEAEFEVVSENSVGIKIIAASQLTPLFNVVGLKKPFLSKPIIGSKGILDAGEDEAIFESVPLDTDDFISSLENAD